HGRDAPLAHGRPRLPGPRPPVTGEPEGPRDHRGIPSEGAGVSGDLVVVHTVGTDLVSRAGRRQPAPRAAAPASLTSCSASGCAVSMNAAGVPTGADTVTVASPG